MSCTKDTIANQTTTSHLFPFNFDKEGPVEAQQFLSITPSTASILKSGTPVDDYPRRSTVIMGRLLEGIEITPPSDCEGYVWKQDKGTPTDMDDGYDDDYEEHDSGDEEDSSIRKNSVWKRTETKVEGPIMLWKKDIAPPASDPRINAIESWISIADMIHQPIPIKH